jgi:hypothetical protein
MHVHRSVAGGAARLSAGLDRRSKLGLMLAGVGGPHGSNIGKRDAGGQGKRGLPVDFEPLNAVR